MRGFNKVRGNMYPDMDLTTNPIRGVCPFGCIYCYIRNGPANENEHYQRNPHIVEELILRPMPKGKRIFVGSSIDMWAPEIPGTWIEDVLEWCYLSVVPESSECNDFLFQSKHATIISTNRSAKRLVSWIE
jgi:DNA repair photolyase